MAHKRKVHRTQRLPAPAVRRPAGAKAEGEREAANHGANHAADHATNHAAAKTVADQVAANSRGRVVVTGGDEPRVRHRDEG